MKIKAVSGIMLTLLLTSMLTLAFNIQPVKASGTIYIRADGSIEPSTANITSTDNVTYYFTDNNYDEIVVERNNIVVDGAGYAVQGSGSGSGLNLTRVNNVTIQNTEIKSFWYGIWIDHSSSNTISGNNITNNDSEGIYLYNSSYCTLRDNNVSHNMVGINVGDSPHCYITSNTVTNIVMEGIFLYNSSHSSITGNNAHNNSFGIYLLETGNCTVACNNANYNWDGIGMTSSSDNRIFHNNFINNTNNVHSSQSNNTWDNGYPSGGNYWSNYTDVDLYSGPNQDILGSDRIWDHSYNITDNNRDRYPFTSPWTPTAYDVAVVGAGPARMRVPDPFFGTVMPVVAVVQNQGEVPEAFNVSIFYDTTLIGTSTVILDSGWEATESFNWNLGFLLNGVYTISANASVVPGETNTADNYFFFDGEVRKTFNGEVTADGVVDASDLFELSEAYGSTTLLADINSDGIVDDTDYGLLIIAYESIEGMPNWNPYADMDKDGYIGSVDWGFLVGWLGMSTSFLNWNPYADMNADNKIDASDLFEVSKNYGKTV